MNGTVAAILAILYSYGRYGHWRGRRSAEQLEEEQRTIIADQEANEFHRGYYDGRRGYGRGRRSADEKEIFTEVLNADQDASDWYDRGYYGYPYSYGRYGYPHSYYW